MNGVPRPRIIGWMTSTEGGREMKAGKILRSGALWAVAVSLLVVGVGQMVSLARPGHDASIRACVNRQTRVVRIPSGGHGCFAGEKSIHWSVRGPQGVRGHRGRSGSDGTFSSSGYADQAFCMKKDGKLEGLDPKKGTCKDHDVLVSIPVKQ